MDGALQRLAADQFGAVIERGFPGGGELLGTGLAAEIISALRRHVDGGGGEADRAGLGQGGDEGALALGRPAVVAGAARDRSEIEERLHRGKGAEAG